MSSSDVVWRARLVFRLSLRDFLVVYPARVLLSSMVPQALMQVLFLVLLGRMLHLGDDTFLMTGALAQVMVGETVIAVADVLVDDKDSGTMPSLRRGVMPVGLVAALRALVHGAHGLVLLVCCLLVDSLLLGSPGLILRVLPLLPLYALMALSSLGLGLAGAAVATGRRSDVLVGNLLNTAIMLGSGVLVSLGHPGGWLRTLTELLPVTHGLTAVREFMAGRSDYADVGWECVVALGWFGVMAAVLQVQSVRARRTGFDEFA
ncbi:ABC transporter permease [Streptomyces aureoversilis]|uniref:ABC transporter permease n=1 Tax=Streptomyces aureoversilis TaxID=67277 RepID=A0ABW0A065_9ACTN